jgi:hypothetical protein
MSRARLCTTSLQGARHEAEASDAAKRLGEPGAR